jgi:antirestriction protein ArdC
MQNTTERKDVYSRITAQIVDYLEKGVRPWAPSMECGARGRPN